MHIWHLRIRASSLQFRASKINMALAQMDKLVKKLMSNPAFTFVPTNFPLSSFNPKKLTVLFYIILLHVIIQSHLSN
jgi:hypothetical protein